MALHLNSRRSQLELHNVCKPFDYFRSLIAAYMEHVFSAKDISKNGKLWEGVWSAF